MTCIDIERLKRDFFELSEIGRNEEDRGIYRTAFSEADMEGRAWFRSKLEEIGLETRVDGAANVFGRLKSSDTKAKTVIVGSHLDTVPCAGALDGSLGVLVGLECLRVLKERGETFDRHLEVVAFSDEEGRFGGMFGSQSVVGSVTPETLEYYSDQEGCTLGEAMKRRGLKPFDALDAALDPADIESYLELHIEQGPVLDNLRKSVGIVENITGLFKWLIKIRGTANHAGTTPMEMRQDAFMGLADFAHEIPRILEENGSELSRATIGRAQILPGAPNTVPGLVELTIDVRDTSKQILEELGEAFHRALSAIARRRKLMFDYEIQSVIEPTQCHPEIVDSLESAAKELDLNYLRMPSGAAHDAQIMAQLTRVGMIFVPSKDGKSHSPAEWTAWTDIESGANLALHALKRMAGA
ncbi:Zn-dependent hydrolase [Pelagicoccus sp. SDUM812003]|uniref:Zn-dependent hydrolase n=1 Tax=Pelagicoccus sp. SDUM812003 TaxID=3041267 RepID=UPI00281021DA|nr:Zn-dependent hydrolase [Pelagicoccus sp. SDUM812003]MDQ8202902.1 Zn-dependent hydrolase [Pelagicoccus sp. SDUM812003]